MGSPEIRELVDAAKEVARQAGAVLRGSFAGQRSIQFKGGIDLVTDADKASEQVILDFVAKRFPRHSVLAEESGVRSGEAPYRWIVDPLDGTTNYAHRVPHFCVSIGVEDRAGLAAAAVYDPVRDELFEAGRSLGARLNGEPIHVSTEENLAKALLATGFPYNVWSSPDRPLKLFDTFIRRSQGLRRAGSAALDLCYVAAGRFDGFFELSLKAWDIAAGVLLVREAGGIVTDLEGEAVDLERGDLIASNGRVHAAMLAVSREVTASLTR